MLSQPDATASPHWPHLVVNVSTTAAVGLAAAASRHLVEGVKALDRLTGTGTPEPLPLYFNATLAASVGRCARSTIAVEPSVLAALCVRAACTPRTQALNISAAALLSSLEGFEDSESSASRALPLAVDLTGPTASARIVHVEATALTFVCTRSSFDASLDASYEPLSVDRDASLPSVESIARDATPWQYPWEVMAALPSDDAVVALDATGTRLGLRSAIFNLKWHAASGGRTLLSKALPTAQAIVIMTKALDLLQEHARGGAAASVCDEDAELHLRKLGRSDSSI